MQGQKENAVVSLSPHSTKIYSQTQLTHSCKPNNHNENDVYNSLRETQL